MHTIPHTIPPTEQTDYSQENDQTAPPMSRKNTMSIRNPDATIPLNSFSMFLYVLIVI